VPAYPDLTSGCAVNSTADDESGWRPETYGDSYAAAYDELHAYSSEVEDILRTLKSLKITTILEFGSGTGRLAIPLTAGGISVTGVEASRKMMDVMQAKPGSENIEVHHGDFSAIRLDRRFDAVLLSRNTLLALTRQDLQIAAVKNAARHTTNDGLVFIDLGIPPGWEGLRYGRPFGDGMLFYNSIHDPFRQQVEFTRIFLGAGSCSTISTISRYIWPSELDLMASLAGLRQRARWSDWAGTPYGDSSAAFVSMYGRQVPAQGPEINQ